MKRSLFFTILLLVVGPVSLAKAEYIGGWRWLGFGWGPGYHSGESMHHGHHHQFHGQAIGPAWEESRPVAPEPIPAAPPELQPLPDASALRGVISPAQQAVIQQEMQRRSANSASKSSKPSFNSYFDSKR